MFKTINLDHVAVNTNDMDATVEFYCGVLGMRLTRTMRTGDGRRHYNIDIGGGNAFAFFESNEMLEASTAQHLNHFAIPVATEEEFNDSLKRLTAAGAVVTDIIERGYGKTFYFVDPNGIRLQIELQTRQDNSDPSGDPDPVPSAAKYLAKAQ